MRSEKEKRHRENLTSVLPTTNSTWTQAFTTKGKRWERERVRHCGLSQPGRAEVPSLFNAEAEKWEERL